MQSFISSRIVVVFLLLFTIQASATQAKDFSGQWETTYGLMTLEQRGDSVYGHYIMDGARCSIEGKVQNRRLEFKYREPNASGEGWFELNANSDQFSRSWRENGASVWTSWVGTRAKEIAYFPEPTVVTIATHGLDDGLLVDGTTITANTVTEGLKYAANLKALHFSSCSVMKDKFGKEVFKGLADAGIKTAVSGYQNPVDWAASALFEMTYLDLLLSRGMNAPEASASALSMFPIAGKAPIKNVPILPGGFEILH